VQGLLPPGQTQGRTNLVAGSWGHVPAGCSSQTHGTRGKAGDWAAHFNRNPGGTNDGGYTVVCIAAAPAPTLPQVWIFDPAGNGQNTCSTGPGPTEGECLGAVQGLLPPGQTQGRTNLVAGSWGHVPAGCSSQTHGTRGKAGDWAAHYNRNPGGQNDGGYTTVCPAPAPALPPAPMEMPPMEMPPAMPPVEMPPVEMPPMEMPPMEGPPGAPPAQVCAEDKKDDAGRCPCPGGCVVDPLPKALANGIVACPSRCYVEVCDSAYYYDAAPVIEKLMQLEAPRVEQLEAKGLDMTEEEFSEYKELVAADGAKLY